MPPQPGVFSVPYGIAHKNRTTTYVQDVEMGVAYPHHSHAAVAGPSTRVHGKSRRAFLFHLQADQWLRMLVEEGKKEKRRKDLSGKLGKEMNDRREE